MSGLNFQTQTIINSPSDLYLADLVDGTQVLKVKNDFTFIPENIVNVTTKNGYEGELCKAVIDFSKVFTETLSPEVKLYFRLDIYLGTLDAEPFIYSTPFAQKGMPLWVEFTVNSANLTTIAEVIANIIKKNHLFLVDKDVLKVTGSGTTLTIEGTEDYQRFRKIELRVFNENQDYADLVAEIDDNIIEIETTGANAFGTYSYIVKNLRLPTAANSSWTHLRQAETPIVGAIYDQIIVEYKAPATNDGMGAVGQRMDSYTTHVFWINSDIVPEIAHLFDIIMGNPGDVQE